MGLIFRKDGDETIGGKTGACIFVTLRLKRVPTPRTFSSAHSTIVLFPVEICGLLYTFRVM